MRLINILICLCILTGCTKKVTKEDLTQLNGYWEIDKVIFHDGSTKEYNVNTSIDYIEISALKGFKKKVQPKFDGTYTTSNNTVFFSISEIDGVFKIHFKNGLSDRTEQIISISEHNFSVSTKEGITYNYRRYQPININQ
ncbi:MAG: hypothetical protein COA50_01835 [Flavobacteriaceae bacterium]|nr:MAG: hypothetical protein COA50_01835 [Flavobacteriaceae bacterium]